MMTRVEARRLALETCELLGPGWAPVVHENLGWHGKAVSSCGRVKVHPSIFPDGSTWYTAFWGESGKPGGWWALGASTPQEALRTTYVHAKDEVATLSAALVDPPHWIGDGRDDEHALRSAWEEPGTRPEKGPR